MLTSYHVHTRWSDGFAEMSDYVRAAAGAGLDELGFSDHYTLLAGGGTTEWSMPPASVGDYLTAIANAAKTAPDGLAIRAGMEVDFIPGALPEIRRILQTNRFDYLIGSVHIVGDLVVDGSADRWAGLSGEAVDEVFGAYWFLVRQMVESGLFDIVGHMDVIGKAGLRPSFDPAPLVLPTLDAIRDAEMVVEVNTSGWHNPCNHPLPEDWILRECLKREIPLIVTADAHEPANLTRDFDRAAEMLAKLGYHHAVWYEDRRAVQVNTRLHK